MPDVKPTILISSSPVPPTKRMLDRAAPRHAPAIILVALLFLCIITYIDYATGPELRFSMYYAFPVLLVTWYVGRSVGYVVALISAGAWLLAELEGSARFSTLPHAIINTVSRLFVLMLSVHVLAGFKNLCRGLSDLVDERTRAMRDLSIRLSIAEESERRRMAHDVHDGLGQVLTLLKFNLSTAATESPPGSVVSTRLSEGIVLVTDLIERCRTLTFDLYPTMLHTVGLVSTIRQYAEQFDHQTQVEVIVNEEGQATALPESVSSYLFRAVKELMTNCAKHGNAKEIVIAFYWQNDGMRIVVDDDGSGFDTQSLFSESLTRGIGLPGIRQRFRSMQGEFKIESKLQQGTRVVLELPLPVQEPK